MSAIFKNDSSRFEITPTADISAGDIVKVSANLIGVATSPIAANTIGYLNICGEYDVTVNSVTASVGDIVSVAGKTLAGVSVTVKFGYAVKAIASTDTVARLKLDYTCNGIQDGIDAAELLPESPDTP